MVLSILTVTKGLPLRKWWVWLGGAGAGKGSCTLFSSGKQADDSQAPVISTGAPSCEVDRHRNSTSQSEAQKEKQVNQAPCRLGVVGYVGQKAYCVFICIPWCSRSPQYPAQGCPNQAVCLVFAVGHSFSQQVFTVSWALGMQC